MAVFIWAPVEQNTTYQGVLWVTVPMWVGSLREGGIKELRKVHAYRKELFSKEDSERAEKTKGQSVTFNVKKKFPLARMFIGTFKIM